jgi:citrate lyase subunit beta / citryl-CoA lyase
MEYLSGNRGPTVRSDCYIRIFPGEETGIRIKLKSKVQSLYGRSIIQLVTDIFNFYGISDISAEIEDTGALPYVIAARMEAAIKQFMCVEKEFLLPVLPQNIYPTQKNAVRRSRLYIPGNNPKLIVNAGLYQSDGVILDLEDSVSPDKKDEARFLVRNALRNNAMMGVEKMVRINQLPLGLEDLEMVVKHPLNMVLIPKCESAETVRSVQQKIEQITGNENQPIWLMPIIESATGIRHAFEIAEATPTVAALAIGLEDYLADIGAERTPDERESMYARSVVVNAARAAGIQPIDSVFPDFGDRQQLFHIASSSKKMGFEGMGCIHPGQISTIHEAYNPASEEIEKAKEMVRAFEKAAAEGLGVVAIGSKMIDLPVVKRAQTILEKALKTGLIQINWRRSDEG